MKLEQVLGLTVCNNCALDTNSVSGNVAYPAGSVVVVYNIKRNKQYHIINGTLKSITSLSLSTDGKYLATGECGNDPCVRVWDLSTGQQVAFSSGHKYGINCVAFSPNMKYVVSIGSHRDKMVNVWDWQNDIKIASNTVSCKVKAISFSENGEYFVTVGNRHVKFWYLQYSKSPKSKMDTAPLMGRSAILGDQRNNYFCDVACGLGEAAESTFAIARSGLLCEFNNRRLLDKWVELRTSSANCLSTGHNIICVGCADGIIRCFNPVNLQFICTLPRPHTLGIDIAKGLNRNETGPNGSGNGTNSPFGSNPKFPSTIAISLDEINKKVTCVYTDHSMYIWDIRDLKRVGKSRSFLYHSACIWGIETYPNAKVSAKQLLPPGTFITCSSDDTVRVWNLDSINPLNNISADSYVYKKNIFSQELLKIFYMDPKLTYICDPDINPEASGDSNSDKNENIFDSKNGVRCIKVSPDGRHLASGHRSGNIRIFDFASQQEKCSIEAHNAEVLSVEYSDQLPNGRHLLASASRDRLIHVFDVENNYSPVQTLGDHSSSITAVKFIPDIEKRNLKMISCGADKSIIFRQNSLNNDEVNFVREHHVVGKSTLYDMDVDRGRFSVVTACQDRAVRVYNAETGKNVHVIDGSLGNDGTLIKVALDPACIFVAASCTDKSLYVHDMTSGDCMATSNGHSELITGLKFTFNGRYLISVSGDSCIFVWKLPLEMANAIAAKLGLPPVPPEKPANIINKSLPLENEKSPNVTTTNGSGNGSASSSPYRFNLKSLPSWAKKQMNDKNGKSDESPSSSPGNNNNGTPPSSAAPAHLQPKGRWAQRIENTPNLVVKSYLTNDAIIPYPNLNNSKSESPANDEIDTSSGKDGHYGRSRHLTDSSSASGSWQRDEEEENITTDSSDLIYYPQSESIRGSTFEIRETNEDELKDRLRRFRRSKSNLSRYGGGGLVPSVSVPNFNELHSDDEDSGTAGGESDRSGRIITRNPLYISTENLDRLDQRERFMKNNFETLSKEMNNVSVESDNIISSNNIESENRSSISARYLSQSSQPTTPQVSSSPSTAYRTPRSSSTLKPPLTKRREELTKAISEARKKLETLGWKGGSSALNSSKSVANLRDIGDTQTLPLPKNNSIRRSISLSDISLTPQRKLLPASQANNFFDVGSKTTPTAPLWERQQSDLNSSHGYSMMKRSTSSTSLRNHESSSYLRPSFGSKSQGLWSSPSVSHLPSSGGKFSSGRMSAPPPQSWKKGKDYLNGSISGGGAGSSDEEETSSESEALPRTLRPGTPPKPNILRQIRRSSTSQAVPNTKQSDLTSPKSRKIWGNFELRSSKSEYNLDMIDHRETLPRTRAGSTLTSPNSTGNGLWLNSTGGNNLTVNNLHNKSMNLLNDKQYDLASSNPASIPLTMELVHNVVDELNHIATYAKKIYHRCSAAGNIALCNLLVDGISKAYVNLSTVVPPPPINGDTPVMANTMEPTSSLPPESMIQTMNLLQQYSDRLVSMVEQRMTKENQKKN